MPKNNPVLGEGEDSSVDNELRSEGTRELDILDDFLNSPREEFEWGKYGNFPCFLKQAIYPKLKSLMNTQEGEQREGYLSNNEPQLINLNYKILSKLYDIAEQMAEIQRAYESNPFFEVCEDFLEKYNDFVRKSLSESPDKIEEQFYQLLNANAVVQTFFNALKETLTLLDKGVEGSEDSHSAACWLASQKNSILDYFEYTRETRSVSPQDEGSNKREHDVSIEHPGSRKQAKNNVGRSF